MLGYKLPGEPEKLAQPPHHYGITSQSISSVTQICVNYTLSTPLLVEITLHFKV